MKHTITLFFSIFLLFSGITLRAQENWQWRNPTPDNVRLNAIKVISPDTIVSVGHSGRILKSTDGGITWAIKAPVTSFDLAALSFTDTNTGYAVGGGGTMLKTTDGGETWNTLNLGTTASFTGVCFTSPLKGVIVGYSGKIMRTINGGATWLTASSGTINHLYAVCFATPTVGFAVGAAGTLLKTTNGGASWTPQPTGTNYAFSSVHFSDANTGYAVGEWSTMLKTINGGISWFPVYLSFATSFTGVVAQGENTIYTSDALGVYKSDDGGQFWSAQYFDSYALITGISAPANATPSDPLFVCTRYGTLMKGIDEGNTWIRLNSVTSEDLNSSYFVNATTGYIAGPKGVILKTTNGGITWTNIGMDIPYELYKIHFPGPQTGYVAGGEGKVYKTTNGGASWTKIRSGGSIKDFYFPNVNIGYLISNDTIFKSTNGGLSWATLNLGFAIPPQGNLLHRIYFTDINNGYIASHNYIYKTIDGGSTWTVSATGLADFIEALSFPTPQTIYGLMPGAKKMIKSTDSGVSWTVMDLPSTMWGGGFYDLDFSDENTGYLVGSHGAIHKTTDGGQTWVTSINMSIMEDVNCVGNNLVVCTGPGGKIVTLNTSTTSIPEQQSDERSLEITPNPAGEYIDVTTGQEEGQFIIMDFSGRQISAHTVSGTRTRIDITQLPAGNYVLIQNTNKRIIAEKFIK